MADKPITSIQDMLSERYGVRVTSNEAPAGTTVGVAVGLVLPNNPRRLAFVLVNMSANAIYVSPDADCAATHGIVLVPNGGTLALNYREDLILPSLNWYAIAAGAGSALYWLEAVIY